MTKTNEIKLTEEEIEIEVSVQTKKALIRACEEMEEYVRKFSQGLEDKNYSPASVVFLRRQLALKTKASLILRKRVAGKSND